MKNNFESYKEELKQKLGDYLREERKKISGMTPEEEKKYIKENDKDQEIQNIYISLQNKYNIEPDNTQK